MMQEQQKRFELPSGAQLAVTVASFQDAMGLLKECLKTLRGASFSKEDLGKEISEIMGSPTSASMIMDRLVAFATSDGVEAALFKCFERALYIPNGSPSEHPGVRVNRALFDNLEYGQAAREDYAQMAARIVEVNCAPFLAKALSGFLKPKTAGRSSAPSTLSH